MRTSIPVRRLWLIVAAVVIASLAAVLQTLAQAETQPRTDTVLILHTNDIHARLKPNRHGIGGMPYVSGYVREVREQRPDVLVLDAGDTCEKGDMLEVLTRGEAIYRAMKMVGYDAGAPGNHDFPYGLDQLKANGEVGGFSLVCASLIDSATRKPVLTPYIEKDIDGVRVGIIGGTISGGSGDGREMLDVAGLAEVMKRYVAELEPRVELIVALVHRGSKDGRQLSSLVPGLDVIVTGHTHEMLAEPIIADEGGAIIVQAGQYAQHVGRLELRIDMDTEEILEHEGSLVQLRHNAHEPDEELSAAIVAWNKETCPEADELLAAAPATMESRTGLSPLGEWTVRALQHKSGADVALLNADMFREKLYAGPVTLDDLYRTLVPGTRREVRLINVSGAELLSILEHRLSINRRDHIAGLSVTVDETSKSIEKSDIDPNRTYDVALPRAMVWPVEEQLGMDVRMTETGYTVLDAMVAYARNVKTIVAPAGD